jgi:hypothetical protein
MSVLISQFLKEKAIAAVSDMIAKGTDKEYIQDAPDFFVSESKRRLCLGTIEVNGKQYYVCQRIENE